MEIFKIMKQFRNKIKITIVHLLCYCVNNQILLDLKCLQIIIFPHSGFLINIGQLSRTMTSYSDAQIYSVEF